MKACAAFVLGASAGMASMSNQRCAPLRGAAYATSTPRPASRARTEAWMASPL